MIVSNDFALRMMGLYAPQVPEDKHEMTDEIAQSCFMKIGEHQTFVDISRCFRLISKVVKHFTMCTSLLYLDISYTCIGSIDALKSCVVLKGLNLAGLDLVDPSYSALMSMKELELINLRSSNISDICCLSELACLRSLDLGHTSIATVTPICNKTRLEELLLDCATIQNFEQDRSDTLHRLQTLTSLKLLNYCQTDLSKYAGIFRKTIPSDYHTETSTRWEQFLLAVINNDARKVHELLCSGQDINMRAGPDDMHTLLEVYKSRCVTARQHTPFVLCDHDRVEKRPAAVHFAVLFNSYEALQCLLDHHCDKHMTVWFGDVEEFSGILVDANAGNPNPFASRPVSGHSNNNFSAPTTPATKRRPELSTKADTYTRSDCTYSVQELIDVVFQRNVHRITDKMVEKKIMNWKSLCATYRKQLLFLYNAPKIAKRLSLEDFRKRNAHSNDAEGTEEGMELIVSEESQRKATDDSLALVDVPSETPPVSGKHTAEGVLPSVLPEIADSEADRNSESRQSEIKPKKQPRKTHVNLQPRPKRYQWRDHIMVKKLTGSPIVITETIAVTDTKVSYSPTTGTAVTTPSSRSAVNSAQSLTRTVLPNIHQPNASFSIKSRPQSPNKTTPDSSWVDGGTTFTLKETSLLGRKSFWLESRAKYCRDKAQREAPEYCDDYNAADVDTAAETGPMPFVFNFDEFDADSKHIYSVKRSAAVDYSTGKADLQTKLTQHRKTVLATEGLSDREKIAYHVSQAHGGVNSLTLPSIATLSVAPEDLDSHHSNDSSLNSSPVVHTSKSRPTTGGNFSQSTPTNTNSSSSGKPAPLMRMSSTSRKDKLVRAISFRLDDRYTNHDLLKD